ncbi:MAG: hypothetical protein H6751_16150 [Candidatus Omnitrophica bacterium]|nr:hypothetical protein [Candidatus Omnitrophota bacterium]
MRTCMTLLLLACPLSSGSAQAGDYLNLVRRCADTLLEIGRDHYGEVHSPLFMCVIDAETLNASREMPLHDGLVRTEGRLHRRNLGGCDLWEDQELLKTLYLLTEKTGDEKYKKAADNATAYFLKNCIKPSTGLLTWGSHIYWDAYTDSPAGDGDGEGPHEVLIREPEWERMWEVDPKRVREQIERMWEWHICDKETGQHNRHDDKSPGCDFAFSGSEFIYAFAFLSQKTGEPIWEQRAKLVMNYHWNARNKETNLAPDAPALHDRYDGNHAFTTIPGPHASLLLRAYELTKDRDYLEVALGHLRAYDQYGWDDEAQNYWGMLELNGTPVPEYGDPNTRMRSVHVYDDFQPVGYVDVWRTVLYSYEMPLIAAQSYAYAAQLSDDPQLKKAVERWSIVIEKALPPKTGRRWKMNLEEALPQIRETGGTYAENYGRAISFFLEAALVLDRNELRVKAEGIAREAIDHLHREGSGLFLGHAAKGTYEATDGVGCLLYALLQLDSYPEIGPPNF